MKMTRLSAIVIASLLAASRSDGQAVATQQQNRPMLEQQLRERVAEITRKRLQLDDAQMAKLEVVNSRFAPQLGALTTQERETRQQLRRQLTSAAPDEAEVGQLLDNLIALQKKRITLLEGEQKDLSGFLTPVQRAKYMGLQAQIKKRAEQLRMGNTLRQGGRAGKQLPR